MTSNKNIESFPYHKHKDNKVLASKEIGLKDVLSYIFKNLKAS